MSPRERADRDARALELHLAGIGYAAIARACGYSSRQAAYKAVQTTLAARRDGGQRGETGDRRTNGPVELTEEQQIEIARLDALLGSLWARARRGEIAAVDRVLKLAERRTTIVLGAAGLATTPPRHDEALGGAS